MKPPTLVIVCGLPGSGKTTHAQRIENEQKAIRLCADEWMSHLSMDLRDEVGRAKIESLQWNLAQTLLSNGQSVVIEWGTWTRSEREALRSGARHLDALVELHYLSASVEVLFERICRRGNPLAFSLDELKTWSEAFEEPLKDELAGYDQTTRIDASANL